MNQIIGRNDPNWTGENELEMNPGMDKFRKLPNNRKSNQIYIYRTPDLLVEMTSIGREKN